MLNFRPTTNPTASENRNDAVRSSLALDLQRCVAAAPACVIDCVHPCRGKTQTSFTHMLGRHAACMRSRSPPITAIDVATAAAAAASAAAAAAAAASRSRFRSRAAARFAAAR